MDFSMDLTVTVFAFSNFHDTYSKGVTELHKLQNAEKIVKI